MTLLALTLVVWANAYPVKPVAEVPSPRHVERVEQGPPPAARLPPKELEWFEHAIDHILRGE